MITLDLILKILRGVGLDVGPDDDLHRAANNVEQYAGVDHHGPYRVGARCRGDEGNARDQYEIVAEVVGRIETQFNVDIEIDEINPESFGTPRKIAAFVERLVSKS